MISFLSEFYLINVYNKIKDGKEFKNEKIYQEIKQMNIFETAVKKIVMPLPGVM